MMIKLKKNNKQNKLMILVSFCFISNYFHSQTKLVNEKCYINIKGFECNWSSNNLTIAKNDSIYIKKKINKLFYDSLQNIVIFKTIENKLFYINFNQNPFKPLVFSLPKNSMLVNSMKLKNRYFVYLKKNSQYSIYEISEEPEILEVVQGTLKNFEFVFLDEK